MPMPWSARLTAVWGHRAPYLLIAAILATIALGVGPVSASPRAVFTPVLLLGFVLVSWLLMRQHDRRLCEACVRAMPLNPAATAVKQRRRFAVTHAGANPRVVLPYLVVLIGSNFLPGTVGRIVWALVQLTMVYLILSYSSHRTLQPWCPWCRGGGGGDDEDEPVDDGPRPQSERQLI